MEENTVIGDKELKPSRIFYTIGRAFMRLGTFCNDIETLCTFNPKKIGKRAVRKAVGRGAFKLILKKIDNYDLDQEFEGLITRMGELQHNEMGFYKNHTGR